MAWAPIQYNRKSHIGNPIVEIRRSYDRLISTMRFQRKLLVSGSGMHHVTCFTHVPWCMSGSLTRGGRENVPCIPGACATRNFTYLVRGTWETINTSRYEVSIVGTLNKHDQWILEVYIPVKVIFGYFNDLHWTSMRPLEISRVTGHFWIHPDKVFFFRENTKWVCCTNSHFLITSAVWV